MVVHVAQGDITQLTVDAVVNPANSRGVMKGGVAGALKEAGGEVIESESIALAPIAIGAAIVTGAGHLFCKSVIHVPTMEEPGQRIGVENVRRAARAALLAAARSGHAVVGMPALGTGSGGVPRDEAARAIIDELRAHRGPTPQTVYLIANDEDMLRCFEEAARNATQP